MTRYQDLIQQPAVGETAEGMPFLSDSDYFQRRAGEELARAHEAKGNAAAAHYRLACAYLDLIENFPGSLAEKRAAGSRPAIPLRAAEPRAGSLKKLARRSWPQRRQPR
jgi:hypothetical protein